MNENVSIKEGNITRKFAPIDKSKVDNTDGTSSIWVPEDDLKTGVLYASENGIYIASEDGYDAYSEVVIRVEKRIDDGDLIDESGIDWEDIDFDGDIGNFDELDNWDVDTLEEFSDDLEGFDDLFNDEDKWDEEKEKPITEDEMGDFDGDSISGIDPETGNEIGVSLDEDGFLDEELLPSSIKIIVTPQKLSYKNFETINYAGISVCAYKADGSIWEDEDHSGGIIPFNELVFPVKRADYSKISEKTIIHPDYEDSGTHVVTSVGSVLGEIGSQLGQIQGAIVDEFGFIDQIKMFCSSSEGVHPAIVDVWTGSGNYEGWSPFSVILFTSINIGDEIELGGSYPAIRYSTYGKQAEADDPMKILRETSNNVNAIINAGQWMNGSTSYSSSLNSVVSEGGKQSIPVQWNRPGDGNMLYDTFEIDVSPVSVANGGGSVIPDPDSGSDHTSGGF